jgi:hypothetical protein
MEPFNAKSLPMAGRAARGSPILPGPAGRAERGVRLAWVAVALSGAPGAVRAQLPTWVIDSTAGPVLKQLWQESVAARAERVACLGGTIGPDTVWITAAAPVATTADSLGAGAEASLAQCAPPRWIGTVHTHIRSTDDSEPVARFSPGDRAVMSAWVERWGRKGAFCLLHSPKAAHCEVYPAGVPPREIPAPARE